MEKNENPSVINYFYNCTIGQPLIMKQLPPNEEGVARDIPEAAEKEYRNMINEIAKKLNAVPSLVELIIQEYEDFNQK